LNKALAVKYNKDFPAPFIQTKGRGMLADRLLAIAKKYDIPIVKDNLLTETLYMMDPGEYIPEEVYDIVAHILVFIKETQDLI